jgi:SSS family solute:Na+ symporter
MLVLTVLVGGTYFACSLSRLILPEVDSPDDVVPRLVGMLLPDIGVQFFVLAIVSASLSTATALFHIAATAVAEDLPARRSTAGSWFAGVACCVLISAGCAQIKGQLIALLCATSWSLVGATALVPYLALALFGRRHAGAACLSAAAGFSSCLAGYLCVYAPTAVITPVFGAAGAMPPFFVGTGCSLIGWFLGAAALRAGTRHDRLASSEAV